MSGLDLAVIGNCAFAALLDRQGRYVWACLPRFDGDPVFCALLDGRSNESIGLYDVLLDEVVGSEQSYMRNSAIVVTRLRDSRGGEIEITDLAPRFKQFGRAFRPMTIVRRIRPLAGTPRIRIRLRPACDYGSRRPEITRGSNHIRYVMPDLTIRLTCDAPVAYIIDEIPFILEQPLTLILGPDESLTTSVAETGREFFERTREYWQEWCRYLTLPFEWQQAVIRAAITLKLCNFEETGGTIAAFTTSIPEAPGSGRNWDYRYCWLRDSYFVVHALNRLGVTRTMEGYLAYISNIVAGAEDGFLQPLYNLTLGNPPEERNIDSLRGYRGMGPVRVGNHAYTQVQNDGYGSVVLASAQSFFDERLINPGDETLYRSLDLLGEQAIKRWDKPDSGLWELRTRNDVHTFSSVMCWAACDRLARIAGRLGLDEQESRWRGQAGTIHAGILDRAWSADLNSFTATFGGDTVDASLLLLAELGFVDACDPRALGTLDLVEKRLRRGKHLLRYDTPDDFGEPSSAFNVCTFWYIDALAAAGRQIEARELFEHMLSCRNHVGLLSEDIDPKTGEPWGNFPQTYSMVGLINSAMRLSRPWEGAY